MSFYITSVRKSQRSNLVCSKKLKICQLSTNLSMKNGRLTSAVINSRKVTMSEVPYTLHMHDVSGVWFGNNVYIRLITHMQIRYIHSFTVSGVDNVTATCTKPTLGDNTYTLSEDKLLYGVNETYEIFCAPGYTTSGKTSLICQSSGSWSSDSPTCTNAGGVCIIIWFGAWQNLQNHMRSQRRLRSVWASAQYDQTLRCLSEECLGS